MKPASPSIRPAAWQITLAFTLVYLSWGTTYVAIRRGVHTYQLPPMLFGGVRVGLAGVFLLGYLGVRGESLRLSWREFLWTAFLGALLFVGGNGFMTIAMRRIPSGMASVLGATSPLFMAVIESFWPWGERLSLRGWFGLLVGLGGLSWLVVSQPQTSAEVIEAAGVGLVLISSLSWALGSVILRHRRPHGSRLAAAAYQMAVGGGSLAILGLAFGEGGTLTSECFLPGAWLSFFYLLIVGSLIGFVAFNWLLGHVPAAQVGTHAYVNPMIAVLIGWLLDGEELTGPLLGGMAIILVGVAMVRRGSAGRARSR